MLPIQKRSSWAHRRLSIGTQEKTLWTGKRQSGRVATRKALQSGGSPRKNHFPANTRLRSLDRDTRGNHTQIRTVGGECQVDTDQPRTGSGT